VADEEKNKIVDNLQSKEEEMREIRKQMLDKIIALGDNKKINALKLKEEKPSEEIVRVSKKIEKLINSCNDKEISENYLSQFNKLKQSESMNDEFFYKELHDRILENESSRKNKLEVNEIITQLNNKLINKILDNEKMAIIQKAIGLINSAKVSDKELIKLKSENELFESKIQKLAVDEEIKKKEQHFIKTQIIYNFENLGYEVMDDLEVIDFEKENDFYLQAPGQENLLHIKFKDDGTFRYVFEIPEKKEELSVDEQKMKLHEMKSTCDDFVNILSDLKKMGVDIDIKSEKPIELNSMITIPESINSKLKTQKKQVQRKQQIKKLYLE
jgi:hypothetical protein